MDNAPNQVALAEPGKTGTAKAAAANGASAFEQEYWTPQPLARRSSQIAPSTSITDMIDRIADEYDLCRNRLWEIARSVDVDDRGKLLNVLDGVKAGTGRIGTHDGHDRCTFDFCEHSRRDFTSVGQRHENCKTKDCQRRKFPGELLEEALNNYKPTAWSIVTGTTEENSLIERLQPYMAISHVWLDGTGSGSWPAGEVNECLYNYFADVATRFECDGIWWDTICIPRDNAARGKAILNMQRNYENARITLVHDTFIRQWEFDEQRPELACLAITLSPWFSRGWTALELARSRKVKVIFKGGVIKDLDEDILAQEYPTADRDHILAKEKSSFSLDHIVASKPIWSLRRRGIVNLDRLLETLGARDTSWPHDVVIIAGQLVGVQVKGSSTQQENYQQILCKIGRISHDHLFHNSVTMQSKKGFGWCPTNIFNIPVSSSREPTLTVESRDGAVNGSWTIIDISQVRFDIAIYNWKDTHPLVEARLKQALADGYGSEDYRLLVPPEDNFQSISRGLLVIFLSGPNDSPSAFRAKYIGPLYFQPPVNGPTLPKHAVKKSHAGNPKVSIAGVLPEAGSTRKSSSLKNIEYTDILRACADGDEKTLESILKEDKYDQSIVKDCKDNDGNTPWHLAAQNNHVGVINQLRSKASAMVLSMINVQNNENVTALHLAAHEGHVLTIAGMKGVDAGVRDMGGWTPLAYAVWNGHEKAVKHLLRLDYQPNDLLWSQDLLGQSPLHLAAERGEAKVVRALLGNRGITEIRVQVCNKNQTVLHRAALGGSVEVVKILLGYPEIRETVGNLDRNERTALHIAADGGQAAVVELLLRQDNSPKLDGGNPNPMTEVQDCHGLTPLILAIKNGNIATVKALLDIGKADVEERGGTGKTPLMWAADNGRFIITEMLLGAGASTTAIGADDRTPLSCAAGSGDLKIVELILDDDDIDIEYKGQDKRTPVLWAAEGGHDGVVKLLIKRKADLGAKSVRGESPLFLAARNGHDSVVRLLLQEVVDLESPDCQGETPLGVAASRGHVAVVEQLLEKKASLRRSEAGIYSPLTQASIYGHLDIVKLLLGAGANPDGTYNEEYTSDSDGDASGDSPMASTSHSAIWNILLEHGANLPRRGNVRDHMMRTVIRERDEEVLRILLDKIRSSQGTELYDEGSSVDILLAAVVSDDEAMIQLVLNCENFPLFEHGLGAIKYAMNRAFSLRGHVAVRAMLERGAIPMSLDVGSEMLEWAVEKGHYEIAKILLNKELVIKSVRRISDLVRVASQQGHVQVLTMLLENFVVEIGPPVSPSSPTPLEYLIEIEPCLVPSRRRTRQIEPPARPPLPIELEEVLHSQLSLWVYTRPYKFVLRRLESEQSRKAIKTLEILLDHDSHRYVAETKPINLQLIAIWAAMQGTHGLNLALRLIRDHPGGFGHETLEVGSGLHRTVLSCITESCEVSLVQATIKRDDPSIISELEDSDKRTPLFYAIRKVEVVKLLLAWGVDPARADENGKTALSLAVARGYKDSVKVLSEVMGDEAALKKYRLLGIDHPDRTNTS